jgi:hypothetical protein
MTRSIVFWAVALAIPLACAELASFALMRLRPDLFDQREAVLGRINRKDFERVRTTTASNSLGWDNPAAVSIRARSCLGDREVESTYDSHRTRLHGDRRPGDAVILVAGNSYAHGNEVDDNETLPAQLEQLLGVPTANLGVSGYGPDQALLKLERMIELFPHAKFAILSISYDDATRMLNSFRPILQRPTGRHFGLKPFVTSAGLFREIIGGTPFRDFEAFIAAAAVAFDDDYWRRPTISFPYTAKISEMLFLPSFYVPAITHLSESFGRPRYEVVHRIPAIRRGLRSVYERFMHWSDTRGLRGIIAFVPIDTHDRTSGMVAIDAASDTQRSRLLFHNVRLTDNASYVQSAGCHPSVAGYRMIAESVATLIQRLGP